MVHDEVVGVRAGIPPSLPDTVVASLRDSTQNSQHTQPRGPCMQYSALGGPGQVPSSKWSELEHSELQESSALCSRHAISSPGRELRTPGGSTEHCGHLLGLMTPGGVWYLVYLKGESSISGSSARYSRCSRKYSRSQRSRRRYDSGL